MTADHNISNTVPAEFADIAPYDDSQFKEKITALVDEPGFEHAIKYVMPGIDYSQFVQRLKSVATQAEFQRDIMGPFLEMLAKRTSDGVSIDGLENCDSSLAYTFISNHRDIVLDASFLNMVLIRHNRPLTQVAIGNNLLIYDWITDLVKLNRSFIVKRDVRMAQALEAAKQLSAYIHYAIGTRHESVWIAQREGRAKDSNDVTQESLIKMLSLTGGGSTKENLMGINLLPLSITYEYDPNDYLKAREFLLRRRDPDFKKCQRDDLFSMETGMLGFKGRIHFHIGPCINKDLAAFDSENRAEVIRHACSLIDRTIHCGYRIFPCNYIAYDKLNSTNRFASHYTQHDVEQFDQYIASRLDKVDVRDITEDERQYIYNLMLTMYSNPLTNQITAATVGCQHL